MENTKTGQSKFSPKEVDLNQTITVKNGFQGKLVYVSSKTKEIFEWEDFGDEQEIELIELRNAKSSQKNFFINNWFMFNEEEMWIVDYLGLSKYYKDAISLEGLDDLFTKPASKIEKIVKALSDGQKQSVIYKARKLVLEDKIDSLKTIKTLEKILKIELIEG